MAALGLGKNVTSFTLSDFGRTWKPAANKGTDHGWGNYAFVIGDAVSGGDFYGTLATQALDGPDDLGNAGRWIPTTSLEQYAATLIRWFGMPEADLPYVLPNIGASPAPISGSWADAGVRKSKSQPRRRLQARSGDTATRSHARVSPAAST